MAVGELPQARLAGSCSAYAVPLDRYVDSRSEWSGRVVLVPLPDLLDDFLAGKTDESNDSVLKA